MSPIHLDVAGSGASCIKPVYEQKMCGAAPYFTHKLAFLKMLPWKCAAATQTFYVDNNKLQRAKTHLNTLKPDSSGAKSGYLDACEDVSKYWVINIRTRDSS